MIGWLKRLAGIDPEQEVTPTTLRRMARQDQGPADPKYLRRLFPNSIFTQKLTRCRKKNIRMIMRRLRPDQRAIVRARGWNRGIEEWTRL